MAQRTQVLLIDDIDGGEAVETIQFGLDGNAFEIDLSNRNAKGLREAIAPYVDAARPVRTQRKSPVSPPKKVVELDPKLVREWALAEGYDVNLRGRVPASIVESYRKAH